MLVSLVITSNQLEIRVKVVDFVVNGCSGDNPRDSCVEFVGAEERLGFAVA